MGFSTIMSSNVHLAISKSERRYPSRDAFSVISASKSSTSSCCTKSEVILLRPSTVLTTILFPATAVTTGKVMSKSFSARNSRSSFAAMGTFSICPFFSSENLCFCMAYLTILPVSSTSMAANLCVPMSKQSRFILI